MRNALQTTTFLAGALFLAGLLAPEGTLARPAHAAVEGNKAMYVGGTVAEIPSGAVGTLDTTMQGALVFAAKEGSFAVPYQFIRSVNYRRELARHLGAVPTVAVVLVRHRQRRHFLDLAYTDAAGTEQAVVLEVSKDMVKPLLVVIRARMPKTAPTLQRRPAPQDLRSQRSSANP